ncbi:chondroitin sulfate synthase 1 [Hydra vulgaris]|uniref:Hexosyltransferase n=1 Tax=Hydra vulgaris TaxID=6087 RepID=A0ABM4DDA7_HYDVU
MTRNLRSLLMLLMGLLIGIILTQLIFYHSNKQCTEKQSIQSLQGSESNSYAEKGLKKKKFIFIGVMTAEKYLDSRAKAVYETWGSDLKGYGKLMFFASSQTKRTDLPVISLDGVDDSYPPQRKSMMMLKYMHDNYIDEYEWFVRGDDDVYIRIDKLQSFLRTLNSSDDLYIGQAGTGTKVEKETLGLGAGNNYCMGGPSVVVSASALSKVTPHFEFCLSHLVTTHEDVEVGRCIKNFVGVSCTWAFEMQSLFYHNRSGELAFTQNLDTKAVRDAVTLHPIKQSPYMHRLHLHFMELKIRERTYDTIQFQRRLVSLDTILEKGLEKLDEEEVISLSDVKNFHDQMMNNETPVWEMFTPRKVYSYETNSPEIGMISPLKDGMNIVLGQTMAIINKEARKVLHRTLEFKRLNHGYRRYHPKYGVQYMLDLLMKYHRHIGRNRRRMTVHVRHHAYLQQPFGNTIYSIEPSEKNKNDAVNFILPLSGRFSTFVYFMKIFENVCLKKNIESTLTIVYFNSGTPSTKHVTLISDFKKKYPLYSFRWLEMEGVFSRGLALTMGAAQLEKNSLLFFCDVDLEFNEDFIRRCRMNSIIGKQVYYPIVFSQFSPNITYGNEQKPNSSFSYSVDEGFWRKFGFGITCQYRSDFDLIGGLDTTIQGWGMEDVDLYDRYVLSEQHTVFRAVDPGLVHIYHDIVCDNNLSEKQLTMCYKSKATAYGSEAKLFKIISEKGYLKS